MAQSYTFRLTAEGLDKFKADLTALGAEGERVFNQMRQASPALATAMERAEQATQRSTQALREHAAVNDNVNRGIGGLGQAVGQAGFQLQDFAVQVQMGTSWLTALSQQGSQFLGMFGTGGAIAGAVLTVGALAAGFLGARDATEAAKTEAEAYKKSLESLSELMDSSFDKARKLREETADAIISTQRRIGEAAQLQGETLGTKILGLEEELAAARRTLASRTPEGGQPADTPLNRATQRNIADLESRLASLRGDSAVASATVAEANRVIALARRGRQENRFLYEPLMEGNPDQTGFFSDAVTGPLGSQMASQRRDAEASARRGAQAGESSARRVASDALGLQNSWENFWDAADKRAEDRASKEAEKRLEAEKKATEERERREADAYQRTVERYSADLARGTTDALFEGFSNGANFATTMAATLSRALRTAVAGALDTNLFRPLLNNLLGGAGAGADAGGLGAMFGLSGLGGQLSGGVSSIGNMLGLGGGGFSLSGIGDALNSAGQWSGLFGNGISASLQGPTLGGAALGSLSQSGLFGSLSVTQAIGTGGLGFGAGALAGNIVSGMRGTVGPGGTVGGAAGALAGLALSPILGPLAPILGGVLGGAGGGLFGPTQRGMQSRSGVAGIYTLDSQGFLRIQDVGGKRADTAGFTADLQGQLDGINNALRARGLSIQGGGAWSVGSGPAAAAAGLPGNVDPNRFASMLSSSNPLYNTALGALRGQGADFNTALSSIDWIRQVYEPLTKAASGADEFAAAIEQVSSKWGEIIGRAQSLNLATDQLIAQRDKEIAAIEAQKKAQQNAMNDTAAGLFRDLTFGGGSALAPETQYFAAVSALRGAAGGLAGGGQPALDRYVSIARQALPVARNFLGTSERFGDLQAEVSRTLRGVAPGADGGLATFLEANADGTSRLIEVTASYGAQQVDILNRMVAEVSGLRAQLVGILARTAA